MSLERKARRAGGATGPLDAVRLAANNPENSRVDRPQQVKNRVRLQFLVLHALGPKPLFHFLDVERGADLRSYLEWYAALPAEFIRANAGDKCAPPSHCIAGGEP
jgi:hypothetical protein